MSASASMAAASSASGGMAQALAALSGTRGMDAAQSQLPVDFASLLASQQPPGAVTSEILEDLKSLAKSGNESDDTAATDISALLSEISQPLPPTEIPLYPVAQPNTPNLIPEPSAESTTASTATLPQLSAIELSASTSALKDSPAHAASGKELGGEAATLALPEFSLPDSGSHGMTHATHAPQTQASHHTSAPVQLTAQQPVHSQGWSNDVGNNLIWMAKNDIQSAQLSVNPPNLGPIEITLTLNKDQATAHFVSTHAEVREILEQALPRLREILEGAGVQLGQADVGAQSQQQQFAQNARQQRQEERTFGLEPPTLLESDAVNVGNVVKQRLGNGLVDTFV